MGIGWIQIHPYQMGRAYRLFIPLGDVSENDGIVFTHIVLDWSREWVGPFGRVYTTIVHQQLLQVRLPDNREHINGILIR